MSVFECPVSVCWGCFGSSLPATAPALCDDLIQPHFLGQGGPPTPTIQHSTSTFAGRRVTKLFVWVWLLWRVKCVRWSCKPVLGWSTNLPFCQNILWLVGVSFFSLPCYDATGKTVFSSDQHLPAVSDGVSCINSSSPHRAEPQTLIFKEIVSLFGKLFKD